MNDFPKQFVCKVPTQPTLDYRIAGSIYQNSAWESNHLCQFLESFGTSVSALFIVRMDISSGNMCISSLGTLSWTYEITRTAHAKRLAALSRQFHRRVQLIRVSTHIDQWLFLCSDMMTITDTTVLRVSPLFQLPQFPLQSLHCIYSLFLDSDTDGTQHYLSLYISLQKFPYIILQLPVISQKFS